MVRVDCFFDVVSEQTVFPCSRHCFDFLFWFFFFGLFFRLFKLPNYFRSLFQGTWWCLIVLRNSFIEALRGKRRLMKDIHTKGIARRHYTCVRNTGTAKFRRINVFSFDLHKLWSSAACLRVKNVIPTILLCCKQAKPYQPCRWKSLLLKAPWIRLLGASLKPLSAETSYLKYNKTCRHCGRGAKHGSQCFERKFVLIQLTFFNPEWYLVLSLYRFRAPALMYAPLNDRHLGS